MTHFWRVQWTAFAVAILASLAGCSGGAPSEGDVASAFGAKAKNIKVIAIGKKTSERCLTGPGSSTAYEVQASYISVLESCDKVSLVDRIANNCGEKPVTGNYCFNKSSGEWRFAYGQPNGADWGK
jgi:hypothetical protein